MTFRSFEQFDDQFVLRQLRYTGILQLVEARRRGFSHRLTFADFLKRQDFLGLFIVLTLVAARITHNPSSELCAPAALISPGTASWGSASTSASWPPRRTASFCS